MGRTINSVNQFLPLINNPEHDVWFSYGEVIPKFSTPPVFWGAGKHALALKTVHPMRYQSPGHNWLPNLPYEFLEREIHSTLFQNVLTQAPENIWFKLAETKHDLLPAKRYSLQELKTVLTLNPELGTVNTQWTTTILNLNYEHRFFMVDNKPVTGSPYLIDGQIYNHNMNWGWYEEAEKFALLVGEQAPGPPSYVLDVALNQDTNNWVVVEGNRSWSAGLYGSNVNLVLEAIKLSLTPSDWEWEPDQVVHQYVTRLTETINPEQTGLHYLIS